MIILAIIILAVLYGLFFLQGEERKNYFYNIVHTIGIILLIGIPFYYAYDLGTKPYSGFDSISARQIRMFIAMFAAMLVFYTILFQTANKKFWLANLFIFIGIIVYTSI